MTWFRVDDKLHDHRKARRAGIEAMGLWVLAGSWCGDNLTDGFIPAAILTRWTPGAVKLAKKLVAAELWTEAEREGETGYVFHEWERHQPTRAEVEDRREKRSRAGKAGGQASASARARSGGQASAEADSNDPATPSRPVPSRPVVNGSVVKETLPPKQREPQSATEVWAETERGRTWEDELKLELERFYGCEYPWSWVTRTIELTVGNRDVKDPIAYVMTAVANDRARFGPANVPRVLLPHLALGDLPK